MVDRTKITLSLRIDPALKQAAEKAAADDRRSLTSLIEFLLDQHLKARGYLPKENGVRLRGAKGKR